MSHHTQHALTKECANDCSNDDGLIDFKEFIELDRRYPLILFPAFRLQDRMQKMTLGEPSHPWPPPASSASSLIPTIRHFVSPGERSWLLIAEDVAKTKRVEEYRSAHGGSLPPDDWLRKMQKTYCRCIIRERKINLEKIEAARPAAAMRKEKAAKEAAENAKDNS